MMQPAQPLCACSAVPNHQATRKRNELSPSHTHTFRLNFLAIITVLVTALATTHRT